MEGTKKRAPRPLILFLYPVLVLLLLGILIFTSAEPLSVLDLLKTQYPIDARLLERIANHLEGLGDPARIRAALDRDDEPPTMPAGLTAEASGPELLFSHFADGAFGRLAFRSTYTLVNNSTQPSDGTVDFFDDSGNPLHITIDGVTDSSFPFQLGVGQSTRLVTEGTGAIQSGWARVRSSQPISATSSFGSFDGTRVVTDVGVAASTAGSEFMIFADTIGDSNTGVALANPNLQPITVDLILRDREAVERGRGELDLPALGHVARFVDQLFPDVAGIDEFEGSLLIRSRAPQAAADVSPSGQAEAPQFSV